MRTNCQSFQDRIADLVSGILPERDRREIEEHLTSCAACRQYLQALRQEDTWLTEHFAGIEQDTAQRQEHALQEVECTHTNEKRNRILGSQTRHVAFGVPSTWRVIMNSPFSKLATAAAVIVVAAVTLVVLDRSATPAYALTDISTAFDQAHLIHVEGWQYFPRIRVEDGTSRPPVPIRTWIDLDNSRIRQMQVAVAQSGRFSSFGPPDITTTVTVTEMICDGSYMMTLDHTAKTATFTRVSDYGRQLMAYQQARMLWGRLCSQPALLEDFAKTGQEEIDGRTYDIWQLDSATGMGGLALGGGGAAGGGSSGGGSGQGHIDLQGMIPSLQSRLWLAADTGRLGRAQVLSRIGDGHWQLEQDYHTIDYDVTVPAGTFTLEPPAGYTATNTKETAPASELPKAAVRCGNLECSILANFTLSDGSVILAWRSSGPGSDQTQEPLFANLSFGGALPKLPIELYSLEPTGTGGRAAYKALHLGHTSKAGQCTEWTLYVPRATMPANVKYLSYDVLSQFNGVAPAGGVSMKVPSGVPVKSAEDFDKWVRSALTELSDDGKAPADLTYPKVFDLAQQNHVSAQ